MLRVAVPDDGRPVVGSLHRRWSRGGRRHEPGDRANDLGNIPRLVGRGDLDDVIAGLERSGNADRYAAAYYSEVTRLRDLDAVHDDLHASDLDVVGDDAGDDDALAIDPGIGRRIVDRDRRRLRVGCRRHDLWTDHGDGRRHRLRDRWRAFRVLVRLVAECEMDPQRWLLEDSGQRRGGGAAP